jgi:gliding motility-associated-like protein
MKKNTIILLMMFFSIVGYSQFTPIVEGFESTSGPDAAPSTNWTLSTGNWLVFDNGVGTALRWGISSSTAPPTQVHQGLNSAYMNRQTSFPENQTIEDYLASPEVEIPINGQLKFWTRGFLAGNQGTVYQIKIAPANSSNPTDPSSYTLVQQWTDFDLVTTISQFEEKTVDLSDYAGLTVRIAFVMQQAPIASPFGDRWFIDDVSVVERCFDPTLLPVTNITSTSAQLNWTPPSGATTWEIEVVPATANPTGVGIIYTGSSPYQVTTTLPAGDPLTPNTAYKYFIRNVCANSASEWMEETFTTLRRGLSCSDPIPITSLTYTTTDNTSNYADNYDISQPLACGGTATNYMVGNDVFYAYTATETGTINIRLTPTATGSGIFVYNNTCPGTGIACTGGAANTNMNVRNLNIPVVAGNTYTIVISSSNLNQTVGYTLVIQQSYCTMPAAPTVSGITQTSANFSWATGTASSWEVLVQEQGEDFPTVAGTLTSINTNSPSPILLTSNTAYEVYVRTDCGDGTFSGWIGPVLFRTLCDPFTPGFQEGFNSTSTTEPCWTVVNGNNDANAWNMNYATTPFEGNQSASINTSTASTNNDWLISPQIVLNGNQRLKFRYRVESATQNVSFRVMLSTTGIAQADFTETLVATTAYTNVNYLEKVVNLSGYNETVNIAWHIPQGSPGGNRLYIDNVIIEDIPSCPEPSVITFNSLAHNSVSLEWTNGASETQWQVIALPCNAPAPTAASTGWVVANTNPFTLENLNPIYCYNVYVRAVCDSGVSQWSSDPVIFTTLVAPPVCDGTYVDFGGPAGNYLANTDETFTVCPPTGQQATVTFTSFNVENTNDALYIFDGSTNSSPQIMSTNAAGNVPGGMAGGFWGTVLPGPYTSSSADGCLTFRFRSNATVQDSGWTANIVCTPIPTCPRPTNVTATNITETTATINWVEIGTATQWEVLILPFGSPLPNATTTGGILTNSTELIANLTSGTAYTVYVRSICSSTDISLWSIGRNFVTLITNDECSTATVIPVNNDSNCSQIASGTLNGATASAQNNSCIGNDDDDVWYSFVATQTSHLIDITNISGSTQDLVHVVYRGTCGGLILLSCNDDNNSIISNLVVGNTYFIRVYSYTGTPDQTTTFNICVGTIPPPIATSATQYTVNQLVEDVLLNSTCAIISNITYSTGTNFNSSNGIGYFTKNNSNFPFEDGIILSTGNVANAPGPNDEILGDGTYDWTGDTDLEAIILAATGNPMESNNATKLEFDFIPIIDTINFNFIFASEEYGTFQCSYSDAFAFLLTDTTTGITTNLAVLPNSNIPVSVVTIRNQLYNDGCNSQNEQYFSTFYGEGGSNLYAAPINFNGVTVPLTATATVVPGTQYHIKLVIADRLDTNYDSAVFLEGGSFDIGTVNLGNDLLQSTNNAVCYGETRIIDTGLSPNQFSFTWFLEDQEIANQTGPSITISEPGTYSVTVLYNNSTCTVTDYIEVEFYSDLAAGIANNLVVCETTPATPFNLSLNNNVILNGLNSATHTIKYYLSQTDAEANANPITNLTDFQSNSNPQTIYYEIKNVGGCSLISNFNLITTPLTDILFTLPTQICNGTATPPVLPTVSNNNISGTWTPNTIDTSQTQTYTFVADLSNPFCTGPKTITIEVIEEITPTFSFGPTLTACQSTNTFALPTSSDNFIDGNWQPAVVDYSIIGETTYTFTPNPNQCGVIVTYVVTINPAFTPTFNTIDPICIGETLTDLTTTSIEGVIGTWSPELNNTQTTTYTFTPSGNTGLSECALPTTLTIVVNQLVPATFNATEICSGATLNFPTASIEGFTGTWNPSSIDTTQPGDYTFTPDNGQCATTGTWSVLIVPSFDFEVIGSCLGSNYTLKVNPINDSFDMSTATFSWTNDNQQVIGNNEPTLNVTQYVNGTAAQESMPITFYATVTSTDGCAKTIPVTIDNIMCTIQKGISANNDGLNDNLDLTGFDVKKLTIYNRHGLKVYSKSQYKDEWYGQSDGGDDLPDGTYYYVIEFNGNAETKSGWVFKLSEN